MHTLAYLKKFAFAFVVIALVGGALFASDSILSAATDISQLIAEAAPASLYVPLGGSSCSGWSTDHGTISGWCGWDAPTITKICQDRGYTSYTSYAQGGGGGPVCSWYGASGWRCDSSCTSCAGQTLTSVTCGNPIGGGGAPSCALSLSPSAVTTGGSSSLSWNTSNAAYISIDNGIGAVSPVAGGSVSVAPSITTTYIATVWESFTSPTPATKVIPLGASCNGYATDNGWGYGYCWAGAQEATAICKQNGYNTYSTYAAGGPGGRVCGGSATDWSDWRCDSSCKSCGGKTLTSVTCESPINPAPPGPSGASAQCSTTLTVTIVNPAPTVNLTASPNPLTQGGSATLSWSSTSASSCTGTGFSTGGATSGSVSVSPSSTTSYSVSCSGPGGSGSDSETLTVNPPAPVLSCTLSASPNPITQGGSTSLSWTSTLGAFISINNGIGAVTPVAAGSISVAPSVTTTYTATVWESVTSGTPATITVPLGASCNGGYCYWDVATSNKICQLNGYQNATATIHNGPGGNVCAWSGNSWSCDSSCTSSCNGNTLTQVTCANPIASTPPPAVTQTIPLSASCNGGYCFWDVATAAKMCEVNGYPTLVSSTGGGPGGKVCGWGGSWNCDSSCTSSCNGQTLTSVTCSRPGTPSGGSGSNLVGSGASAQCSFTVSVNATPAPTADLSANPNPITQGDSSTLTWTSTNANSCTGTGFSTGGATSGSVSVTPSSTTTYSVSCTGAGGTATDSVTLTVNAAPTVNVIATKIVCDNESDLPNMSGGAHITSSTASSFLASHPNCRLEPNWNFEWANGATGNPGNNVEVGGSGWTVFPATNASGTASVSIASFTGGKVWVREQLRSGYVLFAGVGLSNVSAEMYCHTDVLNYDNYDFIDSPLVGQTYYCVAFNAPVAPLAPTADLSASPNSINPGDSSTLTWTSTNANSCTGTGFSTGGATSGSVSVTPSSTTTYSVSCTGAGGTATATDSVTITVVQPGPTCSLSLSPSQVNTGQSATLSWTSSNATSGFINNNVGSTSPVASGSVILYPSDDTTYTGTFVGSSGTVNCSVAVDVQIGGGGCQGNCGGGGGLNQPNVVLSQTQNPGEQPFAFVYLSQVPYTGFEAGPVLTAFYWLMLALWSAAAAYAIRAFGLLDIVKRKLAGISGSLTAHRSTLNAHSDDSQYAYFSGSAAATFASPLAAPVRVVTEPQRAAYPSNTAAPAPVVSAAAPVITPAPAQAVAEDETLLVDKLEARAHTAGVLISPEALRFASRLKQSAQDTLTMFGTILDKAVQTYPREEGWVLLSKERVLSLADEIDGVVITPSFATAPAASAAPASPITPSSPVTPLTPIPPVNLDTSSFVRAILSGNREQAFGAIRHGRVDELMANAVTALDALYRARVEGKTPSDVMLAEVAQTFSGPELENVISILAGAVDATYSSSETAAKLALTKIFAGR